MSNNFIETQKKRKFFNLAILISLTSVIKSCMSSDIQFEEDFYTPDYIDYNFRNYPLNNYNSLSQNNNVINANAFDEMLESINSDQYNFNTPLNYTMLYLALRNLLDSPLPNETSLISNTDSGMLVISNIFSTNTNVSYQELAVRNTLKRWLSPSYAETNYISYLSELVEESPLKASIIICKALEVGNYFCYVTDFWDILQRHILYTATESFNKFSILTDILKNLSDNELNSCINLLQYNFDALCLNNKEDLVRALLEAKDENGNYLFNYYNDQRYSILQPEIYKAFKNLLSTPLPSEIILKSDTTLSLFVISNIFAIRAPASNEELLIKNKLEEYLPELNAYNAGVYLSNLIEESPLKTSLIICDALKAGNYFCYISDFWDILQNHILFTAIESFNKFSIVTDFLKSLSKEEISQSVEFLEKNFKLACTQRKLDLAKALLDAKDSNDEYILNHPVDELLYNETISLIGSN
jgi:hypothetical protein